VLLMVARAVAAPGEHEDHRVDRLQLAQLAPRLGVIGQLVVREGAARRDISAH
jgi:hypothetical protein